MEQQQIIVSGFRNAKDVTPQDVNLLKWLEGNLRLNAQVDQIRSEPDKTRRNELKKQLPAITPSGIFETRRAIGLKKHSGLIALDFDDCDPHAAKDRLKDIANVFYAGLSASGGGVWALIPLAYPEHHRRHFDALRADFKALGLIIDPACKDVCRLRFYSYDSDPIFNFDPVPYKKLSEPPARKRLQPATDRNDALERLIDKIVAAGQDITNDYYDWLRIGGTLASIYGEGGRNKFHALSQFYPNYDPRQTDRQFNACLRNPPGFGPAMIFAIAKQYGILLAENG